MLIWYVVCVGSVMIWCVVWCWLCDDVVCSLVLVVYVCLQSMVMCCCCYSYLVVLQGISMNKFGRFTVGLQDPEEDPDGHIAHPYSESVIGLLGQFDALCVCG